MGLLQSFRIFRFQTALGFSVIWRVMNRLHDQIRISISDDWNSDWSGAEKGESLKITLEILHGLKSTLTEKHTCIAWKTHLVQRKTLDPENHTCTTLRSILLYYLLVLAYYLLSSTTVVLPTSTTVLSYMYAVHVALLVLRQYKNGLYRYMYYWLVQSRLCTGMRTARNKEFRGGRIAPHVLPPS